ncbi:hypothetical protein [Paenibacillus montaniterrae]|nr:hypothetical protein [Paenibacillus montaniterrae]
MIRRYNPTKVALAQQIIYQLKRYQYSSKFHIKKVEKAKKANRRAAALAY